jgi:DNA-binding response OmpR family regulator
MENHPDIRILVIDDDMDTLQCLKLLFASMGVKNLIYCDDSRAVMELLDREDFDLIFLNIVMPHIKGDELLASIKRKYPGIPVIMHTGMAEEIYGKRCRELGASAYLTKPVSIKVIRETVLRVIDGNKQL